MVIVTTLVFSEEIVIIKGLNVRAKCNFSGYFILDIIGMLGDI